MRATATETGCTGFRAAIAFLVAACGPSGLMLEPLEPEYAPGAKVVAELRNFTNADVQWGPSETAIGLERRTDGRWNALRTQPSEVGIKPLCVLPPGGHTGRASVCTFFTTLAPNEAPGTYRLKVTVFSNGPVEVTSGPFEVR